MKKKTNKNIIAIESWDGKTVDEPRGGMRSLLTFVADFHKTKFSYNFLYTPEELNYILKNSPTNTFSMLYLALHGKPNSIQTGMFSEFEISLDELGDMMGTRFWGFGLHLASCATLSSSTDAIKDFMDKTGILFLSGYTKYVDFSESSLVDLALINRWMYAKNYRRMFDNMQKPYKAMLIENGFKYFIA